MLITPIYAALLSLVFILLSIKVVNTRRVAKVAIGDGRNALLQRAIAVHNNFAQYAPLSLLLIYFCELEHAPQLLVHALGFSLLISRLVHAYGVSQPTENFRLRTFGIVTNFTVLAIAALYLLGHAAWLATRA